MTDSMVDRPVPPVEVVAPLLSWAEVELRDLPWRRTRDPWAVLVSEIMLQQTQVSRVLDRYEKFLGRFPSVSSCAESPCSAVIEAWVGLGYNRRAANLWRAATVVRDRFAGEMPDDLDALLALPGVGPYTARAVLVFAFERDEAVVDTNVGRLLARWTGSPLTPRAAQLIADGLVPPGDGWRWNQGLFDFATKVCAKRDPDCARCPIATWCAWRGAGDDPAKGSAGVSTPQGRFAGSDRQVRGRIVDTLRAGPLNSAELAQQMSDIADRTAVDRIVERLLADGLAVRLGDLLALPGHL